MRTAAEILRDARTIALAGASPDPTLWLQLGVRPPEARRTATAAGMDHVEDACTAIVHRRI